MEVLGFLWLGPRNRVAATGISMSSYYGDAWATYGVEIDSFEGPL